MIMWIYRSGRLVRTEFQVRLCNSLISSVQILKLCLLIPRLFIFDSSVERGTPSLAAAPSGPDTRPPHSLSAILMARFSSSTSGRPSLCAKLPGRGDSRFSQVSSTVRVSPSHRITALSITFCSSRIFPGQSYVWNSSNVAFLMLLIFLPVLLANRWVRYSTSNGMSSTRSRSGGTWIGKTFNR